MLEHEEKLETEISRLEAKRASTASGLSSSDKAKLRAARQELEKGGAVTMRCNADDILLR